MFGKARQRRGRDQVFDDHGAVILQRAIDSRGRSGRLLSRDALGHRVSVPLRDKWWSETVTAATLVGGLGGRDISPEEFFEMASVTKRAADTGKIPPPRLLYTETELREVRKMQAIAHVERTEERQ